MQSLTTIQLQNMFLAFCSHIITQKSKINSINVFPVPDQDTGSNLASTFEKVKQKLEGQRFNTIKALSEAIEQTALYSAQGNSGIIYTGFIAGFFESLNMQKVLDTVPVEALVVGFRAGAKKAYLSIENPQRGTILDVMDCVTETMEKHAKDKDCTLDTLFRMSFIEGQKALEQTKQQMAVLHDSDVVDAGGLAFVMMLESFYECLSGKKLAISEENQHVTLEKKTALITQNRFEVIFIVENSLMNQVEITELLSPLGDSLDIITIAQSIKVHIHTDQVAIVKEIAASLGNIVLIQVMDMREEKITELFKK